MLKRFATVTSGIVAVGLGFLIMVLFSTNDPYYLQTQLGLGGIAILLGLYLVVAGSFGALGGETDGSPSLSTIMRRDVRGRALRSITMSIAIAVVVGALFGTMMLTTGAAYSVNSTRDKLGASLIVLPNGTPISPQPFYTLVYSPGPSYVNQSVLEKVQKVHGVRQVTPELYLTEFAPSGGCGGLDKVYLLAVDPNSNFLLKSWLPSNITNPLAGHTAITGASVPPPYTFPEGGKFYGVGLTIQAQLPLTGTFMDHVIFVSMSTAEDMLRWQLVQQLTTVGQSSQQNGSQASSSLIHTHILTYWLSPLKFQRGQASAFYVKLDDPTRSAAAASDVQNAVAGVRAYTFDSLVQSASVRFSGLLSTFSISSSLVWVATVIMVAAITSIGINERRVEIGMIRALGGTRGFISKLVTTETVVMTGIAGVIGVFATWVVFSTQWTTIMLAVGLPYITPSAIDLSVITLLSISIAMVTGLIGAIWPARIASHLEPYEAARATLR